MGAVEPAVMVIDDDEHLREAMYLLLEEHGYEVSACAGAREALERLEQGAAPDLILLDLLMPRMDGWEFRLEQKRDAKWASIPVVALSADHSAKARAIDAHAYLSKPVDEQVLLETVDQLVHALASQRVKDRVQASEPQRSLSALASGLAHEVNNPLSFVIGNLELAQRRAAELGARAADDAPAFSELRRMLARGQRGAERIKSVMKSVSSFEHDPVELITPLSLHPLDHEPLSLPPRESVQRPSVLVIDDEPLMCELMVALLSADYEVTSFTDPRAALATMLDVPFDVILCDLMMPELTGMDVFDRIADERPELASRFVFISGGAFTERARHFLATTRRPQVRKPFHRQQLIDVIELLLTPKH